MYAAIHDILDEAAIAFDAEGVSEKEMRDAMLESLRELASKRLGAWHELTCLLSERVNDNELMTDLSTYNEWDTPNTKDGETGWKTTMNAGCAGC